MSDNAPEGTNGLSFAPWNKEKTEFIQVPVTVTITYSKDAMVVVPENYTKEELEQATVEQIGSPIIDTSIMCRFPEKRLLFRWDVMEYKVEE